MTEAQDRVVNFYATYAPDRGLGPNECCLINGGTWPARNVRVGVQAGGLELEVGPSTVAEVGPQESIVAHVRVPSGVIDAVLTVSWEDHTGQRRTDELGPPQNAVH